GPVFELLKGTCKSCTELEYHLEQHYLAFSDKLDWTNPEGDRIPQDLSKPLPLLGDLVRLYIPADYLFNKDPVYLRYGNLKERKYTALFIKAKATRYEEADFPRLHLNDIEDMFLMYYQNKLHHLDDNI
nr:hypothetical protein [Tanacetum cinerariifolium]